MKPVEAPPLEVTRASINPLRPEDHAYSVARYLPSAQQAKTHFHAKTHRHLQNGTETPRPPCILNVSISESGWLWCWGTRQPAHALKPHVLCMLCRHILNRQLNLSASACTRAAVMAQACQAYRVVSQRLSLFCNMPHQQKPQCWRQMHTCTRSGS